MPHQRNINFPPFKNSEVSLVIETNFADFLIHKDFRAGEEGEPLSVETFLGWTIMGGSYNVNKKGVTKQELSSDREKLIFNPLSAKLTKWLNTLKQFVGNLPTSCLSVFGHFVGLALKGLIDN